jgi:membrane protein YqaA with SNARE-associated domain
MNYLQINRKAYDWLKIFSLGGWALALLCLWAFFEASFWFIAPDFIIILLCFLAPKQYKKFIFIALIVSLLGGIVYYVFTSNYFNQASEILMKTPFSSEKSIESVGELYSKLGVYATMLQSITFVPFKIWTYTVVKYNLNSLIYFILVGISRLFRFFILGLLARYLKIKMNKIAERHILLILFVYTFIFLGIIFLLVA